eukprot:gene57864-biopygen108783
MLMETGKSSWKKSPWGVPQGSVLGPLLFALFCADIADAVTEATLVQFADDVTLCVVAAHIKLAADLAVARCAEVGTARAACHSDTLGMQLLEVDRGRS